LVLLCLGLLALGCFHGRRLPFSPTRPWLQPGLGESRSGPAFEPFPERQLDRMLDVDPPHALARIDEIFRQIALLDGVEPDWRLAPVEAEIDSIRAGMERLHLGVGSLFRLRLGQPRAEEAELFRRAANLQLRWGLALMRTGDVSRRIWGAQRLREAARWDPDSPITLLILAGCQEIGGFWLSERDLLDTWAREHGPNDAVDLQRLRKRERPWKVERDLAALQGALSLGSEMADRRGGWGAAPGWLNLEHARLLLQADSLQAAEMAARLVLRNGGDPGAGDDLSAAQAELLLGLITVRQLDYPRADEHFRRVRELAVREPSLTGLVSWMQVPWDLWSVREQADFDIDPDRSAWVDRWWLQHDPVLATPLLRENQLEYLGRVAEAWFALGGVDLAVPGPLTDPGQVILRFGRPDEWAFIAAAGAFRADANRQSAQAMSFSYRLPGPPPGSKQILFLGNAAGTHFSALDSLRGPEWPNWLPRYGFENLDDRLNTTTETLRRPAGGIRLVFCFDTWLPEYSVRYPLQGFRFDGEARVRTAVLRPHGTSPSLWRGGDVVLDHESAVSGEWPLRRRSGVQVLDLDEPGAVRLATQLVLRDAAGRVVTMAVDNGREFSVEPFSDGGLDASSLVLLAELPDTLDHRQEREIAPGCLASGPDLLRSHLVPRAEPHFLQGEELAFYLEAYNLSREHDTADAELSVVVEHLDRRGEIDYSVGTGGPTLTLTRPGVGQWNIARSLGMMSLDPGMYRLRVNVYDRRVERRVERTVDFQIDTTADLVERCGWDRLPLPGGSAFRESRTAEDQRPR
jgi:hypothetical protein